ncbi:MAG: MBL fold metallo-hydrolase [Nocardioides sp.]
MRITTLPTPELGNRSYLVDDGTSTVIIDPQRDIDRIDPLIEHDVAYVLETHIHNDYVSGGAELARRTGAAYGVNRDDPVRFEHLPLEDGQVFGVGSLRVRVLATPGHTDTHLSYLVTDVAAPDAAAALFSGGSLLHGTVGRTDLMGTDRTEELSRAQWRSARRLAALDPGTLVMPTHGFGSFCAAGRTGGADGSTIGDERTANTALVTPDEQTFVRELIDSLTAHPRYYAQMADFNLEGPPVPSLDATFARADRDDLARRIRAGSRVIDLRPAAQFAQEHLTGTLSIALGAQFATYLGWLTQWGEPITVIGPKVSDLIEARRQLVRIGIEPDAWSWGSLGDLADPTTVAVSAFERVGWLDFRPQLGDTVLDVRRDDEFADAHVAGAVNIPLHDLQDRVGELPIRRTWVYCQSGFRAGTAASILAATGIVPVYVDDDFSAAGRLGLTA